MDDIRALERDLGQVPARLAANVVKVIPKTGLAMKKRMQADLRTSNSFKQVALSVNYDVKKLGFGDDAVIQVEIGPDKSLKVGTSKRGGPRTPGNLANLAYFGGANGGGGTVPDPVVPMRLEAPVFFGFMEMAAEGLL